MTVLAATLLAGCASSRPVTARVAPSPREEWLALRDYARRDVAIQSFSRVRIRSGGRRSDFNARMTLAGTRFRVDLMTPLGTTAATLHAQAGSITVLDHLHNRYWRGSASELQSVLPMFAPFVRLGVVETARLLFGIPSEAELRECGAAGDRQVCYAYGGVSYAVTRTGLSRVVGDGVTISYEPPAFPPVRIRLDDGTSVLEIEHLEVVEARSGITPLEVPAHYECCAIDLIGGER